MTIRIETEAAIEQAAAWAARAQSHRRERMLAIPPEAVVGWGVGKPPDFSAYAAAGLEQPRRPGYYSLDNPACARVVRGVIASGRFDDPVILLPRMHEGRERLFVLNGSTRLFAAALASQDDPTRFERVDARLAFGADGLMSDSEAAAAMVAANLEGRSEPLDALELAAAVARFRDLGWSGAEICERLGRAESFRFEISRLLKLHAADDEIKSRVASGRLGYKAAVELLRLAPGDQRETLDGLEATGAASFSRTREAVRRKVAEGAEEPVDRPAPAPSGPRRPDLSDEVREAAKARGREVAARLAGPSSSLRPVPKLDGMIEWLAGELRAWELGLPADDAEGVAILREEASEALQALARRCAALQAPPVVHDMAGGAE